MAAPTTSVLDTFTKADGALGSGWNTGRIWSGQNAIRVVSNQAAGAASVSWSDAYWNTQFGTGTMEVHLKNTTAMNEAGAEWSFYLRMTAPGGSAVHAYWIRFQLQINDTMTHFISRFDGSGTEVSLANATGIAHGSGDEYFARAAGTNPVVVEVFRKPNLGTWGSATVSYSDTSANRKNPANSYIGFEIETDQPRFDNFGGGIEVSAQQYTKGLTGGLSFTGAPKKRSNRIRTGGLSFTGATKKQVNRIRTGGLSFSGSIKKRAGKVRTGGLSFTASIKKRDNAKKAGALSFTTAVAKRTYRKRAGTLSFSPSFLTNINKLKALAGALSFSGSVKKQIRIKKAANLTPAGAIRRRSNIKRPGSLSFSGSILRHTLHKLFAELDPTAIFSPAGIFPSVIVRYAVAVEELATGAYFHIERREVNESYTTLSTVYVHDYSNNSEIGIRTTGNNPVKIEAYHKSGAGDWHRVNSYDDASADRVNPSNPSKTGLEIPNTVMRFDNFGAGSAIAASIQKFLTASLSFAAAVKKRTNKKLAGAFSFSTSLLKSTSHKIAAELEPLGSLRKRTSRLLAGALSFTGSLTGNPILVKALAATLSFTTTFTKRTNHKLAGTVDFTASLLKLTGSQLAGALSFNTEFAKRGGKALVAALTFSGAWSRIVTLSRTLAGTISFAPALSITAILFKTLGAVLTFSGGVKRHTSRKLAGLLNFLPNVANSTTFPVAPIYDNFNRTDSGSLGTLWEVEEPGLKIISNQLATDSAGARARTSVTFNNDQEVYVTVAAKASQIGAVVRVFLRIGS